VLLRFYLKLDSQALTLCVQMPVLISVPDGCTVEIPCAQCCVNVCLTNFYRVFLVCLLAVFLHMCRLTVVNIFCLLYSLMGLVPEIKID